MVRFTISLESIYNYFLFFVNNKVVYIYTLQTMHLPLGLPSHLSSLLPFLKNKTKQQKKKEQVTKKFSERKQAHVGIEPSKTNQTRWEWHHNTFTPSLHLVQFCQLCTQNSLLALWPIHTHYKGLHDYAPTRHSALLTPQLFAYNMCHVQRQQKLTTYSHLNCHTNTSLLMDSTASAYKTDHICHAQWQLKLQLPTTWLLHAHQHALHTHAAQNQPTAFHNPPIHTNNKHKA